MTKTWLTFGYFWQNASSKARNVDLSIWERPELSKNEFSLDDDDALWLFLGGWGTEAVDDENSWAEDSGPPPPVVSQGVLYEDDIRGDCDEYVLVCMFVIWDWNAPASDDIAWIRKDWKLSWQNSAASVPPCPSNTAAITFTSNFWKNKWLLGFKNWQRANKQGALFLSRLWKVHHFGDIWRFLNIFKSLSLGKSSTLVVKMGGGGSHHRRHPINFLYLDS